MRVAAGTPGASHDTRATIMLILVLGGSLALNVRLGWKLRGLESTVAGLRTPYRLPSGVTLPPIPATDLGGKPAVITYAGYPPTVLYVFAPPCRWCARNLANIQALASARGGTYRFVGLSLSDTGLREYVAANNLRFPVYTRVAPEAIRALRLGGTPHTLVVSSEGKLLKNWVGAYGNDLQREIERYFDVRLPGLAR